MQDLKALEGKSLAELREIDKALGIPHLMMKKKDLIEKILNFTQDGGVADKAPPKLPRKPVGRVLPRRNPLRPPSKYGSNPPHRPRRHRLPQRQKRAVNAVAVPPARNRPPLHSQAQILPNQR